MNDYKSNIISIFNRIVVSMHSIVNYNTISFSARFHSILTVLRAENNGIFVQLTFLMHIECFSVNAKLNNTFLYSKDPRKNNQICFVRSCALRNANWSTFDMYIVHRLSHIYYVNIIKMHRHYKRKILYHTIVA